MNKITLLSSILAASGIVHAQVNTVYGNGAGVSETNGNASITALGYQALYACSSCANTTAVGAQALRVSSGAYNTGVGFQSMVDSTSGYYNTALGAFSMTDLSSGSLNTGIGYYAIPNAGTGTQNLGLGYCAGCNANSNGSYNIWIGSMGLSKDNAVIRIGTAGQQKFTSIAGIYGTKLAKGGQAVYVSATGQLGIVNVKVVTQADILALRQNIVAVSNRLYKVEAENAVLKARLGVK